MSQAYRISTFKAFLLTFNVMVGAGLFVNAGPLAAAVGSLGFAAYILGALILLPVVLSFADLAALNPVSGGMYAYSNQYLGQFWGFLSGWSYFLGKSVSAAFLVHTCVKFFYAHLPLANYVPMFAADWLVLAGLALINANGVFIGGRIQYFFITLKSLPLLFVFGAGMYFFGTPEALAAPTPAMDLLNSLPIVVFAFASFEATCLIAGMLEHKNHARLVILGSFGLVVFIYTAFQFLLYGSVGTSLSSTQEPIKALGEVVFGSNHWISNTLNSMVFASILGGSFGTLSSNCWNLQAIAADNRLPGSKLLARVNSRNVPIFSLAIEVVVASLLLAISRDQFSLQSMFVFSVTTAYLLGTLSFIQTATTPLKKTVGFLGVASCCYLMQLCIKKLILYGISTPFLAIYGAGIVLFFVKKIMNRTR